MRYRVGEYASLVEDMGYVVQRKVWYGWKTIAAYWHRKDALAHADRLRAKGFQVEFHI